MSKANFEGTSKIVQVLAGIGSITLAAIIVPLVVGLVTSLPDLKRYIQIKTM
jgi:hypothetical protein